MGIQAIDEEKCTGCEVCVEGCPLDVLRMDQETGKARIAYPLDCGTCYLCKLDCPADAVIFSPALAREPILAY